MKDSNECTEFELYTMRTPDTSSGLEVPALPPAVPFASEQQPWLNLVQLLPQQQHTSISRLFLVRENSNLPMKCSNLQNHYQVYAWSTHSTSTKNTFLVKNFWILGIHMDFITLPVACLHVYLYEPTLLHRNFLLKKLRSLTRCSLTSSKFDVIFSILSKYSLSH